MYRRSDCLLLLGVEGAQGMGQRHTQGPFIDFTLQRLAQLLSQGQTQIHPSGFAAAGLGNGFGAKLLLAPERPNHPSFIHWRQRAGGAVGLQ